MLPDDVEIVGGEDPEENIPEEKNLGENSREETTATSKKRTAEEIPLQRTKQTKQ